MMAYKHPLKIKPGQPGTTFIATYSPAQFDEVFRCWQTIPDWAVGIASSKQTEWELWIANEFIDWVHYRETGKYQPVKFLELKPVPPVEVPIWLPE